MIKKLFPLVMLSLFTVTAFAQLPVSTTPENRNVVLEEFTGIHCQYCPDGHKIANNLAAANPGDVVLINIHSGGYAVPNPGEPDFRTSFGAAIDNQSNLAGYPAGTINRHEFPGLSQNSSGGTAMSRGDWATAANQVLGQTSYVNVALEADLDFAANTLTVDVEMYFTGTGAPATMLLNVALLQDNIPGPQIDGGNYNPSQWLPSGLYNHQHMLRHLFTGQWGDAITTTTMGTLVQKQYVYTLPSNINGVPLSKGDLEIAAFVTEDHQEVISGAKGPINYIAPPGASFADLEVLPNPMSTSGYCNYSFTPEIIVKNNSSAAVDSFEVEYTINNGTATSTFVTTALAPGASTTVTFPQAGTLANGKNQITYRVSVDNVNKYIDLSSGNDFTSNTAYTLEPTPFDVVHQEGFETSSVGEREPYRTLSVNPDDIDAYVVDKSVGGISYPLAAKGNKSFRWRLNTIPQGKSSMLMVQKLDFSQSVGHHMAFYYAYGQINAANNDQLEVLVSKDCGVTWNIEWSGQGSSMATTSPNAANYYYPTASDFKWTPIDLGAYDGEPEVVVAFRATSDMGNTLYIDEVEIGDANNVGLNEETVSQSNFSVFPNPASHSTTLDLNLETKASVAISINDVSGKQVRNIGEETYEAGSSQKKIELDGLTAGVYILNITVDGKTSVQRLNVVN